MSSEAALALSEAQALSSRSFSGIDRRRYFEHLLTLPSYKDTKLNAVFAESITRDFGEFEDLQDQAVDAILDLCEDEQEQTRIQGIKALAEIGRVEPRWVTGNTGVLVQLLECPPRELVHVKKALFDLLEVSPSDVFTTMAEDCKNTDDNGSRSNILNFLRLVAVSQRRELLESGNYIEVEQTFATVFYDILSNCTTTERIRVLEMLLDLSTVSGKNSTRETMGRFAKAIADSKDDGVMSLWIGFTKKAENLDPRWTIYFLSNHGSDIVRTALAGDEVSKKILEFTDAHNQTRWRRYLEDREDRDLDARQLIPRFVQTMLEAGLRHTTNPAISTLERIFYATYTLATLDRSRDLPQNLSKRLNDFGIVADRHKRNSKDRKVEQSWRNLRDMAEIMADRREKMVEIKPSWTMRDRSRSRSPVKAINHIPPAQPASASASSGRPVEINRNTAVGSRQISRVPPQEAVAIKSETPRPISTPSKPPPGPRGGHVAPQSEQPPSTPPLSQDPAKLETTSQGLSIKSRAGPVPPAPTPTPAPAPEQEINLGFTIRSRATGAQSNVGPSAQNTPQGLSIRSAPTPITTQPKVLPSSGSPGPSLLSRLSSAPLPPNQVTNKRPRNDDNDMNSSTTPTDTTMDSRRLSLADRLGPTEAGTKRLKVQGTSLLSRMTSDQPISNAEPQGFTLKRSGLPAPSTRQEMPSEIESGLSIKNRATPTPAPSSPSAGLQIRGNRTSAESNTVPVTSTSTGPSIEAEDDEPIIRRGRGFAARQIQEILITPPNMIQRPSGRAGDLAKRLGKFGN